MTRERLGNSTCVVCYNGQYLSCIWEESHKTEFEFLKQQLTRHWKTKTTLYFQFIFIHFFSFLLLDYQNAVISFVCKLLRTLFFVFFSILFVEFLSVNSLNLSERRSPCTRLLVELDSSLTRFHLQEPRPVKFMLLLVSHARFHEVQQSSPVQWLLI